LPPKGLKGMPAQDSPKQNVTIRKQLPSAPEKLARKGHRALRTSSSIIHKKDFQFLAWLFMLTGK
jgi:hypothetical protein